MLIDLNFYFLFWFFLIYFCIYLRSPTRMNYTFTLRTAAISELYLFAPHSPKQPSQSFISIKQYTKASF